MAVPFLNLTNSGAIRATLGLIKAAEMPDAHIVNSHVAEELETDLLGWVPYTIQEVISAGAGATPTAKARRQYLLLSTYATVFCAVSLASTFSILIQKSISDGQNEMVRQNQNLEDLVAHLTASRDSAKRKFLELSGQTNQAAAGIMSSISPSYDPVTNETT